MMLGRAAGSVVATATGPGPNAASAKKSDAIFIFVFRRFEGLSPHQAQGQRVVVAVAVGGFDGGEDGEDERANAKDDQQRDADDDQAQREAADGIDENGQMKIQRLAQLPARYSDSCFMAR